MYLDNLNFTQLDALEVRRVIGNENSTADEICSSLSGISSSQIVQELRGV
jgi:hypothetical protein